MDDKNCKAVTENEELQNIKYLWLVVQSSIKFYNSKYFTFTHCKGINHTVGERLGSVGTNSGKVLEGDTPSLTPRSIHEIYIENSC